MEKSVSCEIIGCGDLTVAGLRAMAQGFRGFVNVIQSHHECAAVDDVSIDTCQSLAEVLDSWPEKLSAWRAALYISSVILHTHLEIIGTSSSSQTVRTGRPVVGHL